MVELGKRVMYIHGTTSPLTSSSLVRPTQVELDLYFAPEHNFHASVHRTAATDMPANINDEDLHGHGPVKALPPDTYTVSRRAIWSLS